LLVASIAHLLIGLQWNQNLSSLPRQFMQICRKDTLVVGRDHLTQHAHELGLFGLGQGRKHPLLGSLGSLAFFGTFIF
jgi:hypothetical protein